ncbi:MAG: hypothetical protein Q9174_005737 [Haloplaca sp. 1 TL-2023]
MGHSQGGGAAWAAAQRQHDQPVEGYLGAIAASPITNVLNLPPDGPLFELLIAAVFGSLQHLYPEINISDVLTDETLRHWQLYQDLRGGIGVYFELFKNVEKPLLSPHWRQNPQLQDFITRTCNGGKAIEGPLLVLQGLSDANIDAETTSKGVRETTRTQDNPGSAAVVEYHTWDSVSHDPLLYASQQVWLGWIEDRFAGKELILPGSAETVRHAPFLLPRERYHAEANWVIDPTVEVGRLAMP